MKVFQNPTGSSAEDEQNNKRHARRHRIYLIILAVWVALLVILTAILTPMLILQRQDINTAKAHRALETALGNNFTTTFRNGVLNAISAVYGIQGYIMGELKTLPNLTDTKAQRVSGQYFPHFDRYAELANSSASSLAVFLTAPGAVTYQFFPNSYSAALGNWDLLDPNGFRASKNVTDPTPERPTAEQSILSGALAITGPYNTSELPFVASNTTDSESTTTEWTGNDQWWIDLRQPVYKPTTDAEISKATFWGFAMVAMNVRDLIETANFIDTMAANRMNYTMYTNTTETNCVIIVSSWAQRRDCNTTAMQDFFNDATVHDVLDDQLSWKIAIRSQLGEVRLTANVRNSIVFSSVLGTALVFSVFLYIIITCTRVYDGSLHAPKMAPFAMLTVGLCRGEELWDLASDQMVEVTERLGRVLARQMRRHHAYQIQQVHPLTTSYVTRTVSDAVLMAFDTIEELQNSPIDDPLRRLLGDDGTLLLSYAVHWCTDAVVRLDSLDGVYRYEGPDVVFGGRMWVFAAPNVVTISEAALRGIRRMCHVKTRLFDSVFLRGVAERQNLFVVYSTNNHKLKEAEAVAAEQVRRARQAQHEVAAKLSSNDVTVMSRRRAGSSSQDGYDSQEMEGVAATNPYAGLLVNARHPCSASGHDVPPCQDTIYYQARNRNDTPPPARRAYIAAGKPMKKDGTVIVGTRAVGAAAGVGAGAPLSIVVPSSATCDDGAVAGRAVNPLVLLPLLEQPPAQERRMVRRPSRARAAKRTSGGLLSPLISSSSNDSDLDDGEADEDSSMGNALTAGNKTEEMVVVAQDRIDAQHEKQPRTPPTMPTRATNLPFHSCGAPLPALPPIGTRATTTTTALPPAAPLPGSPTRRGSDTPLAVNSTLNPAPPTVSSRLVLNGLYGTNISSAAVSHTGTCMNAGIGSNSNSSSSSSISSISSGPRYTDAMPPVTPLVVVPPSTQINVPAGGHGHHNGGMLLLLPPAGAGGVEANLHGRRTVNGPPRPFDNPLAHDLTAASACATAQGGNSGGGGGPREDGSRRHQSSSGSPSTSEADPVGHRQVSLDNFSSDLLLRPAISSQSDELLRTVFDRQAVALDVSYDSVRILVYYFYSSYKILFRPLAASERHNIYRRLMAAFSVPQQGILEHLAARCAIRFLQRHEETQTLLWDRQRRLQVRAASPSGQTTASQSVSDEASGSISA